MTSTLARPLEATGARTDTVLDTRDLLGALADLQERAQLHHIQSLTTDIHAWAGVLDDADRREFHRDLSAALNAELGAVERVLREWRITAEALSDEVAREILLGESAADDYVEVERPG